jgi:WD40 repeat protein
VTVGDDNTAQWWSIVESRQVGLRYLKAVGWSLAHHSDHEHFALGLADGTVRLCSHAMKGERDLAAHEGSVKVLAYAPDGSLLASGGADGIVKIWDTTSAGLRATLKGHARSVESLAFSPDGKTLATASTDGNVRLWEVASAREKALLPRQGLGSGVVAFSPDGRTLASAGGDGAVRLRDWPLAGSADP